MRACFEFEVGEVFVHIIITNKYSEILQAGRPYGAGGPGGAGAPTGRRWLAPRGNGTGLPDTSIQR